MVNIVRNIVDFLRRHPIKARCGIVVILFSILIYNIHPRGIINAFQEARPRYLMYAVVLMIPNLLMQALKWRFVMRNLNPKPSFKTTVISLFGGFFLGASTPGRTGELARGILIPEHATVKIASLSFVDKGFSQLTILLFGLIALGFLAFDFNIPWHIALVPFVIVVLIIAIVFNIHRLRPLLENFFHRFTKSERVDHALAAFDALSVQTVLGMIAFSIPFYLIFSCQYYCIIRCFTDLSFIIAMKTIPLIFTASTIFPIAIGDFGVKEFFAVNVLGPFGIGGGSAFSATVTQNVLTFLMPSFIGGIIFMFTKYPKIPEAPASDDHRDPLSP